MIKLGNGCEGRFYVASGALAFDGKGWPWEWFFRWVRVMRPQEFIIVVKSLTRRSRVGNMPSLFHGLKVVKFLHDNNVVNSIGLTNPGIEYWVEYIYPKIDPRFKIVISIFAFSVQEAREMIQILNQLENIVGIELNVSCPNTGEDFSGFYEEVCRVAVTESKYPLILKIGYDDKNELVVRASEGFTAIHCMNTIPYDVFYSLLSEEEKKRFPKVSPLAHLGGGGVSGPGIHRHAIRKAAEIRELTDTPLIIGGGIWSLEDVQRTLAISQFKGVSFGTLFLKRPWRPNMIVSMYRKSLKS